MTLIKASDFCQLFHIHTICLLICIGQAAKIPTIQLTQTFHLLMFIWYQLKNYRHCATAHVRRLRKWRYFNSLRFRERPRYPINSFVAGQNCKHGATNIWTTSLKTNSCANATSKSASARLDCSFSLSSTAKHLSGYNTNSSDRALKKQILTPPTGNCF